MTDPLEEEIGKHSLKGIAVSPGIAIGRVFILQDSLLLVERQNVHQGHAEKEVSRLTRAIREVIDELTNDSLEVSKSAQKQEAEIFLTHVAILKDPYFVGEIVRHIRKNEFNAESAVVKQVDELRKLIATIVDPHLRDCGGDLRDIERRLIEKLIPHLQQLRNLDESAIVASSELTPSDTVRLDTKKVLAFVTESGGRESHAAILARSFGIPAVVGLSGLLSRINEGDTLVVDGGMGMLLIQPPPEVVRHYRELQKKDKTYRADLQKTLSLPSSTLDEREIRLWANITGPHHLEYALRLQAHGIGLFRTKVAFLASGRILSEDEQFFIYQRIVSKAGGREVTIRTLDFGGDKCLEYEKRRKEKNPFLGYRSIRILLKEEDIFRQQLRAILRASVSGMVKIVFPMISAIEEFRKAKVVLEHTKTELLEEGIPFDENIPSGVMIEVPSAAIVADQLAREADFLSIGTNDLIQYTLAVDRDNEFVNHLYQPLNPAVIRLIQNVVRVTNGAGKQVIVCGEMAGSSTCIPLLVGMGLTNLSMNPSVLLEAKRIIRSMAYRRWQSLVEAVMELTSAEETTKFIAMQS